MDKTWPYINRKKITIGSQYVGSVLNDFVIFLDLTILGSDFFENTKNAGSDIRITKADGISELPREIVFVDTVGSKGEVHFRADLTNEDDNSFFIYYNNPYVNDYPVTHELGKNAVWKNYVGVWHFKDLSDSSGSSTDFQILGGYDYPSINNTHIGSGLIGDAVSQTSRSSLLHEPINFGSIATISFWNKANPSNDMAVSMYRRMDGGTGDRRTFSFYWANNTTPSLYAYNLDGANYVQKSGNNYVANNWNYTVGTFNGSEIKLFNNAVEGTTLNTAGTFTGLSNFESYITVFGTFWNESYTYPWVGSVDELRIYSGVKSAEEVETEFNNQGSVSTFFSVGDQEYSPDFIGFPYNFPIEFYDYSKIKEYITSDVNINIIVDSSIISDGFINKEFSQNIFSDSYIKQTDRHIYSDSFIILRLDEGIVSDSHITKEFSSNITSNTEVFTQGITRTIPSAGFINREMGSNYLSDSHIKNTMSESILSDSQIKKYQQDTITSDAIIIKTTYSIVSDVHIKNILSNNIISNTNIEIEVTRASMFSDSHIVNTFTENITSDTNISTEFTRANMFSESYIWTDNTSFDYKFTFSFPILEGTIDSNAHIWKELSGSIVSDTTIEKEITRVALTADANIQNTFDSSILSDQHITDTYIATLISDTTIFDTIDNNILSDQHIWWTGSNNIYSNQYVSVLGSNSIVSDATIETRRVGSWWSNLLLLGDQFRFNVSINGSDYVDYQLRSNAGSILINTTAASVGSNTVNTGSWQNQLGRIYFFLDGDISGSGTSPIVSDLEIGSVSPVAQTLNVGSDIKLSSTKLSVAKVTLTGTYTYLVVGSVSTDNGLTWTPIPSNINPFDITSTTGSEPVIRLFDPTGSAVVTKIDAYFHMDDVS